MKKTELIQMIREELNNMNEDPMAFTNVKVKLKTTLNNALNYLGGVSYDPKIKAYEDDANKLRGDIEKFMRKLKI